MKNESLGITLHQLKIFWTVAQASSFTKASKILGLAQPSLSQQISKLEDEVIKLAEIIASKSNKILKIGKSAFYKQLEMPLEKAYEYTSEVMTENMMTLDAKEGISAFIEKRKPKWQNK